MIKSIPTQTLLSSEIKSVLEEVVKQKQPALAYFKLMKFTEMIKNRHTDVRAVYQKLKEQSPDIDPLEDEEFKSLLNEPVEFEALPEVLFSNVELSYQQSHFAAQLVE